MTCVLLQCCSGTPQPPKLMWPLGDYWDCWNSHKAAEKSLCLHKISKLHRIHRYWLSIVATTTSSKNSFVFIQLEIIFLYFCLVFLLSVHWPWGTWTARIYYYCYYLIKYMICSTETFHLISVIVFMESPWLEIKYVRVDDTPSPVLIFLFSVTWLNWNIVQVKSKFQIVRSNPGMLITPLDSWADIPDLPCVPGSRDNFISKSGSSSQYVYTGGSQVDAPDDNTFITNSHIVNWFWRR